MLDGEYSEFHSENDLTKPRKGSYPAFQFQHAGEARSPYYDLLNPLQTLKIINIYQASQEKRASLMTETGIIPETHSQVPPLFAIACSEILKELHVHSIALRTTASTIDHLPHAPKPPTVKYKGSQGGVADTVIPYGNAEAATTCLDPEGRLQRFKQNPKYLPNMDEKIGDLDYIQYKIPLEKIIMGLAPNVNPPQFTVLNAEAFQSGKTSFLEFMMESPDPSLSKMRFQVDLKDYRVQEVLPECRKRQSPAANMQPDWWPKDIDYLEVLQKGYPLSFDPDGTTNSKEFYEPFYVYARRFLRDDGTTEILPITRDQDIMCIPRPEDDYYDFGDLAYETIDTHQKDAVDVLIQRVKDIQKKITDKELEIMDAEFEERLKGARPSGRGSITAESVKQEKRERDLYAFDRQDFINQSGAKVIDFIYHAKNYMYDLGVLTPYEAYIMIAISLREEELAQQNPQVIQQKLGLVQLLPSVGIQHIVQNHLDVDLHPEWFNKKHDPETCVRYIDDQLEAKRRVIPSNLFPYMQAKEEMGGVCCFQYEKPGRKYPHFMAGGGEAVSVISDMQAKVQQLRRYTAEPGVSCYLRDAEGQITHLKDNIENLGPGMEILLVKEENKVTQLLHFKGDRIYTNLDSESGRSLAKEWMKKLDIQDRNINLVVQSEMQKPKPRGGFEVPTLKNTRTH